MEIISKEESKLYKETSLSEFLEFSPLDPEGWKKALKEVRTRSYPREELSQILMGYNRSIDNDSLAFENIEKLKSEGSYCVITGQQLGFMGGPAYTILKGITCLALAKKAQAVPIFWLATEDHDVGEIDHTYLIEALGNLRKFRLSLPKEGQCVEDLELTSSHQEVIESFLKAVENEELLKIKETSYAKMMAKVLTYLFRGTGMVFLEPYLLRPLAKPFFKKEIEQADEISEILKQTTQKYREEGGEPLLDVNEECNLFLKVKGKYRSKIGKEFAIDHLLELIDESPELFSTNAAARPVLQNSLFPTVAYVGGAAEIAYHHQLKEYHHFHGTTMPWITPRLSATFLTPEAKSMLEKCHLHPWDRIPLYWPEVFPELKQGVKHVSKEWLKTAKNQFLDELSEELLTRFVKNSAKNLQKKVSSVRLKHEGISTYSLHYLRNLIHPHENLQERVINWFEFQSHTEENLIQTLLSNTEQFSYGHNYIYL